MTTTRGTATTPAAVTRPRLRPARGRGLTLGRGRTRDRGRTRGRHLTRGGGQIRSRARPRGRGLIRGSGLVVRNGGIRSQGQTRVRTRAGRRAIRAGKASPSPPTSVPARSRRVTADQAMTSARPAIRVTALTVRQDQVNRASILGDHRRDRYQATSLGGQRTRCAATGDHRTILPATALAVRGTSQHRRPPGSHSLPATRRGAARHHRTARHRTAKRRLTSSSPPTGKPRPRAGITALRRARSRAPAISRPGINNTPVTHRRAGTHSVAALRRMPGIRSRAATHRRAATRSNRVTPSQRRTSSTPVTRRQARTRSTMATRRRDTGSLAVPAGSTTRGGSLTAAQTSSTARTRIAASTAASGPARAVHRSLATPRTLADRPLRAAARTGPPGPEASSQVFAGRAPGRRRCRSLTLPTCRWPAPAA
jgi:hypothetical protein